MMRRRLTEADILCEKGDYWALMTPKGHYEVYKIGITHSTRCAQIGFPGEEGLARVRAEIDRRILADRTRDAVFAARQLHPCL